MLLLTDMSHPANMIGHDHPSFGTSQAWFMFGMRFKGSITKILLVDAKTPWAVQCIERLLGDDQKVSDTCECISVFRDCDIGIRNDLIEEVSFQEFMEVIVDKKRLLDDGLTIEAFGNALKAPKQLKAPESGRHIVPPPRRVRPAIPIITTVSESVKTQEPKRMQGKNYARVQGVLLGLGYKSGQVNPILDDMDINFERVSCDEIVHLALQKLACQ